MTEPGSNSSDFERLLRETYRMVYQIAYSALANAAVNNVTVKASAAVLIEGRIVFIGLNNF